MITFIEALQQFFLDIGKILLSSIFFSYAALLLINNIQRAWKSKDDNKKWIALYMAFVCLAIFLGMIR